LPWIRAAALVEIDANVRERLEKALVQEPEPNQLMPTRVVISGATGRMGQALVALIRADSDFSITGGIDQEAHSGGDAEQHGFPAIVTAANAGRMLADTDLVIDFSAPEGLRNLLQQNKAALSGKAIVIGTTGLNDAVLALIRSTAQNASVIQSANYSIGVNLMLGVVAAAARVLQPDRFDVEIIEAHHRHKADAPSGTALLLGRTVADARGQSLEDMRRDGRTGQTGERPRGEIAFHALRGGEVVGEHRVLFLGAHERFGDYARRSGPRTFAEGALLAAKWLVGKPPGLYTMIDVLGLTIKPEHANGLPGNTRSHRQREKEDTGHGVRAARRRAQGGRR
jgi:4-hydroxy-tetrahydrodipicolinate reductase